MNKIENLIQARLRKAGLFTKATFHTRLADKIAGALNVREYLEGVSDAEIFEAVQPPAPPTEEVGGTPK